MLPGEDKKSNITNCNGRPIKKDTENKRRQSIMNYTLVNLKISHKEVQLYGFTAVIFTNIKGSVHSPGQLNQMLFTLSSFQSQSYSLFKN